MTMVLIVSLYLFIFNFVCDTNLFLYLKAQLKIVQRKGASLRENGQVFRVSTNLNLLTKLLHTLG